MDLKNEVVLVTGGSSGLGEKIALSAAKKGATVIVCARREELIKQVATACEKLAGKPCYGFTVDIADPKSIDELLAKVNRVTSHVDILVNAAGFGWFNEYVDFDFAVVEKMFRVNVLGLMYLTKALAIEMMENHHGHIVNIVSQAGKMATPKSSVYSATKFAVLGFSNALRLELAPHGVFVTTVNPGPIKTNFFNQADPSGDYLKKIDWLVLEPEKLGERIVGSFLKNRREINAPWFMEGAGKFYQLFPHIGDFLAGGIFNKK